MGQNGQLSDDNRRSDLVLDGSVPQPLVPNFLVCSFFPDLLNLFPVFSCLASHIFPNLSTSFHILAHLGTSWQMLSSSICCCRLAMWRPPPCCHLLGRAFYLWTAATRSKFCRPWRETHWNTALPCWTIKNVQISSHNESNNDLHNSLKLICPKLFRSRCRHAPSVTRTLQTAENHLLTLFLLNAVSQYSFRSPVILYPLPCI